MFTGVQQDFEQFKTLSHTNFEDKDQEWFSLVVQTIVKIYHNIVADRTERNSTTPMQTDLKMFSGTEHDKMKITEGQLKRGMKALIRGIW